MHCSLDFKVETLLQRCSFKQLKQIHALIITSPFRFSNLNRLKFLRRSTEFGDIEYPELIFSRMVGTSDYSNVMFWNAMMRGYSYNGPADKCISMYDEMFLGGIKPNNYTYPYVLHSLIHLRWFRLGQKLHCRTIKDGFQSAVSVSISLFNLYVNMTDSLEVGVARNAGIDNARAAFYDVSVKPIEVWNRMIFEYVRLGDAEIARELFDVMPDRDIVTWNSMISCYARVGDVVNARYLFEKMPNKNVISWTSMIGMYASTGDLATARKFFDEMPDRNLVSWNCMISGYNQNGKFDEALNMFLRMQSEGVGSDGFTIVSALSACSHLGDLGFGRWVHSLLEDWSNRALILGTALVEMYAKCGDVNKAFTIFTKLGSKDVYCFNVMIKSLAIHGRAEQAIKVFYLMQKQGFKPNDFSFSSALFACSHGGLVPEGRKIFCGMERDFGIIPKLAHYGCMVDLLCRCGHLEEAWVMVREMPLEPDVAIWSALLWGCGFSSDLKLAEHIVDRVSQLRMTESSIYVLLSNIHAAMGQWPEALQTRGKIEETGMRKNPGNSNVITA